MAYIGKYIRQILSRQEPVILPGFGSLIIVESKGLSGPDGKIDPPGAQVKFDPEHPKGDGKLAEEYAKGELLDEEEARQQVLELVDAIKFKLDKGEEYVLDQVGVFSRDDDNKVHFQKDSGWVLDPDLFGLASLDLLELEEEKEEKNGMVEEGKDGMEEEGKPLTEQKPLVEKKPEAKLELKSGSKPWERSTISKRDRKKWRVIWIIAASLIVLLVVVILVPVGDEGSGVKFAKNGIIFKNNRIKGNKSTEGTKDTLSTEIQQEVDNTEQTGNIEEQIGEGIENIEQDTAESYETGEVVSENKFFVIAGSFKSIDNANELLVELESRGFPAELISTENKLYRVSVQGFKTREEGQKGLSRIQQEPGLAGAWLMAR